MSQANMEAVRELYRGWARGDFTVAMELFDRDVEFISHFGVDRLTGSGAAGLRKAWREQLRNWEAWRTGEIRELRDLGDCVLVIHPIHGRGRASGVEVEIPDAAAAFRFREGKIVWLLASVRLGSALEALGLAE